MNKLRNELSRNLSPNLCHPFHMRLMCQIYNRIRLLPYELHEQLRNRLMQRLGDQIERRLYGQLYDDLY